MRTPARHRSSIINGPRGNRGMALVIALIFLLMLTLLGVASLSSNTAQERMTYAAADYSRAFQAADSAIMQGERWLSVQPSAPAMPDTSGALVYPTTSSVLTDANLLLATWWTTNGLSFANNYPNTIGSKSSGTARLTNDTLIGRIVNPPLYVVQYAGWDRTCSIKANGPPCPLYYRVTADGFGVQPEMNALLQSIYAVILQKPP